MSKVIYKYTIEKIEQTIHLPIGAEVLDIQYQNGLMTMWVLHELDNPKEPRYFRVYGTGWDITVPYKKYLKSLQDINGYVWHVFEMFEVGNNG